MIPRSLRAALVLVAVPLLLASCDALTETANVLKVKFSSADPGYTGPDIQGPSPAALVLKLALPTYAGGITKDQALGQYSLVFTFHVVADNRGNSGKASFSNDLQPQLNFYLNSKSNNAITATIAPFEIDSGAVKNMDFPVSIPLDAIDRTVLRQILNGDPIPYFLTGTLNFHLMQGVTILGKGFAEVDLATGAIPTRPSSSFSLSDLTQFL